MIDSVYGFKFLKKSSNYFFHLRREFRYSYQSSPTEGHIWKSLKNVI